MSAREGDDVMTTVGEVMKSPVVTVKPDDKLLELINLCRRLGIRHLPVVEGHTLVGIISDRTLRQNSHYLKLLSLLMEVAASLDEAVARTIMVRDIVTTTPQTPISAAAKLMGTLKIGCLPVLQDGGVVGIVTESDLLAHMGSLEVPSR